MSSKKKLRITMEGKIKLTLSIALVVYSIIVSCLTRIIIAIPMLFSFNGDVFLMKNGNCFYNKSDEDFKAGVFMFMLSHLVYADKMNTSINHIIIPLMAIVIITYTVAALWIKNKVIVSAIYVIVLILSVINTHYFNTVAFIGGVLFLISDFSIGFFDIIKKRNLLRHVIVWGTYVPAQILMISSFLI